MLFWMSLNTRSIHFCGLLMSFDCCKRGARLLKLVHFLASASFSLLFHISCPILHKTVNIRPCRPLARIFVFKPLPNNPMRPSFPTISCNKKSIAFSICVKSHELLKNRTFQVFNRIYILTNHYMIGVNAHIDPQKRLKICQGLKLVFKAVLQILPHKNRRPCSRSNKLSLDHASEQHRWLIRGY